jgi:two-component system phosphate regulon sensor histidine kinase PhoR
MPWILGLLLLATLVVWLRRESLHRRRDAARAKRAAELLREHEQLRNQRALAEANLEIILSSMQEGVLVLDKRRNVRLANPAAKKLFHLPTEYTGRPVIELLREPDVDEMVLAAVAKTEACEAELDMPARKPPMVLAVRVAPMRDASGEAAALAMFRDIGHTKRLEEVRREFVANVSHELRTPLAIFQGYLEQLMDTPEMPRAEQAEAFEVLARHSKRLAALVEDLLVLARMESREEELFPEEIVLPDFLAGIARDFALRAKVKGVTLRVDVPADIAPLYADPLRMEQVFTNLTDNALKFTPEGGTVTLGARLAGNDFLLWVSDTGQGILSSHLPHIFERFYRVDKGRSRDVGGTGLGLSIVKHIALAHGGAVEAESTFGKGTTIRLRLPRQM